MKDAFTTGEVAKYCGVNFRTVIRWIEKGYIEAYKLPGRGDNRVPISALLEFLEKNDMPIPEDILELSHEVVSQNKKNIKLKEQALIQQKNKVLIIEDEELMAKSMVRTLTREGYEVDVALNGIEAGIKLEVFKPQLITLDLQMPGMSGFEVLEALESNDKYTGIKILVVSASSKIKVVEAMSLGVDDVLEKPFQSEELIQKLKFLAKEL